ncbi:hypothetical protein [Roseiconus lacunae]|uniref:hypothetical protein n=1 Tax=Roseiconus lacunae TaxID=2605694 RepID=UPI001E632504|nr:hypothetical protein [Roseiconus lacunae]MCD0457911.1 hypothetical protein [Roseiconus lacunae]
MSVQVFGPTAHGLTTIVESPKTKDSNHFDPEINPGLSPETPAAPARTFAKLYAQQSFSNDNSSLILTGARGMQHAAMVGSETHQETPSNLGERISRWFSNLIDQLKAHTARKELLSILRRCRALPKTDQSESIAELARTALFDKYMNGQHLEAYQDAKKLHLKLAKHEVGEMHDNLNFEINATTKGHGVSTLFQLPYEDQKQVDSLFDRSRALIAIGQCEKALAHQRMIRKIVNRNPTDIDCVLENRLTALENPPNFVSGKARDYAQKTATKIRQTATDPNRQLNDVFLAIRQAEKLIQKEMESHPFHEF